MRNMSNYFRKISIVALITGLSLSVIFGLIFLMALSSEYKEKLEIVNVITQVVVATSALLAFVNYFESKTERKIKEAINQVSFFREHIITLQTKITKLVKKEKGNDFNFIKMESIDTLNIESSFLKLKRDDFDKMSSVSNIEEVYLTQLELLNKLEEFALNVRLYELTNHKALECIHSAFIEIIELNIYLVAVQRTIGTSASLFSDQLSLYCNWEKFINRQSPEMRLEKLKSNIRAMQSN